MYNSHIDLLSVTNETVTAGGMILFMESLGIFCICQDRVFALVKKLTSAVTKRFKGASSHKKRENMKKCLFKSVQIQIWFWRVGVAQNI